MKTYDILGYAIDGAFYCPDCADNHDCPLFVSDAQGDEVCDECFYKWFEAADPRYRSRGYVPDYVYLMGEAPKTYETEDL